MYFKQIQEIIDGTKTQTRRAVKTGQMCVVDGTSAFIAPDTAIGATVLYVYAAGGRLKWRVGRDYAVSPGRGLPCALWRPGPFVLTYQRGMTVSAQEWKQAHLTATPDHPDGAWRELRIVITAIRLERLQDISEADARAEGYPQHLRDYVADEWFGNELIWYRALWDTINTRHGTQWEDNPAVWVLEFEVK